MNLYEGFITLYIMEMINTDNLHSTTEFLTPDMFRKVTTMKVVYKGYYHTLQNLDPFITVDQVLKQYKLINPRKIEVFCWTNYTQRHPYWILQVDTDKPIHQVIKECVYEGVRFRKIIFLINME